MAEATETREPGRRRALRWGFWIAIVALALGHLDVAFLDPSSRVVLGWIPFDLAYHLGWILAAAAVVFVMAGPMWEEAP